jgi:pimeloyl-ACP methyl ester carboxylesterase
VIPYLSATRRVIAFDIAGFGSTPPLAHGIPPTLAHLVDDLERTVHAIGVGTPVDIAGNSLGGTIALEAARRGLARSVVAISPMGLWSERPARHVKYVFGGLRLTVRYAPRLLKAALRTSRLRALALAVPLSLGSARMPVGDALRAVDDLARSRAFEDTFAQTQSPFVGTGITVPLTVAFGDRDWILTKGSRRRNQLPAHTRWIEKHGWGHVPMWIDPAGVSRLIVDGTAAGIDAVS